MLRVLIGLLLLVAAAPAAAQPPTADGTPIAIGTSYRIQSRHLEGPRTVNIRLPAGYPADPLRSWPVLYLLDGGVEQDFPHIAGIVQHADISWTFEHFILVGVESVRRPYELAFASTDERYDDYQRPNGGSERMRAFLRDEVKPFVEARLRVSGEDVLIGESLAGLFVVETLLRAPDLFDTYIAISPSLWWSREALPAEAPGLLARHDSAPRRLYLTVANEGGSHRRAIDTLVAALERHAPAGLDWRFIDRSATETHGSIYHEAALDALRSLYPLPFREGPADRYPWLFAGEPPPLSADAQASLALGDCTRAIARRTTMAEIARDPAYWRGMCVIVDYGPVLPGRERRPGR